jgi:hypothetical protein
VKERAREACRFPRPFARARPESIVEKAFTKIHAGTKSERTLSMTSIAMKRRENDPMKQGIEYRSGSRSCDWRTVGAIVGLAGGIGGGLLGALLTAVSWLAGETSYARTCGMVLLLVMTPLLVFGAHCLDLTDKRKDAERKARFGEEN